MREGVETGGFGRVVACMLMGVEKKQAASCDASIASVVSEAAELTWDGSDLAVNRLLSDAGTRLGLPMLESHPLRPFA